MDDSLSTLAAAYALGAAMTIGAVIFSAQLETEPAWGAVARTSSENGDPPSLSHSREGPVRCGEGAAPAKVEFAEWPLRAGITSVSLMVFENLQARDVPLLLLVGRDRPTSLQFSREGQAVSRDEISIQGLEPYQKAAAVQTPLDQWAGFDAVQPATATQ